MKADRIPVLENHMSFQYIGSHSSQEAAQQVGLYMGIHYFYFVFAEQFQSVCVAAVSILGLIESYPYPVKDRKAPVFYDRGQITVKSGLIYGGPGEYACGWLVSL